ncbi:hypothetical protein B0H14DRAFT_2671523 [Mycena olivaceomarginata]|nr:hypothetical protein B0H14DRAFT_2671523 [Mycena olivaceomarginata]
MKEAEDVVLLDSFIDSSTNGRELLDRIRDGAEVNRHVLGRIVDNSVKLITSDNAVSHIRFLEMTYKCRPTGSGRRFFVDQVTEILSDLRIEVWEDHAIKRLLIGFVGSRTSTSASSSTTLHDPKSIKTKEKNAKALAKGGPVDRSKIRNSGQDIDKRRSDRWCHMNSDEDEEDGSPRKQRGSSRGKTRGL